MEKLFRRTKIVCTLGPATDRDDVLEQIIAAGADVLRLNFSHGKAEDHARRAEEARAIAARLGRHIAIMGDLQGPKIRVSTFAKGKVLLKEGDRFTLDAALPPGEGDETKVGIDYKELPSDVEAGDILLLDDGRMRLEVEKVEGDKIVSIVSQSGPLSDNKGINKQGGGLSAEALTEKDKRDIETIAAIAADYLAVSFPRSGADIRYARELAQAAGCRAKIIAKVERAEAVATDEAMDDIILASDVVMVARGDLGVEIGDPELPGVQKKLIRRARQLDRVAITATQMMESMIKNPLPTRAEVLDVANAVIDGTDAVMLSAETAAGDYPVETVKAMVDICLGAEKVANVDHDIQRGLADCDQIDEVIAHAAVRAANEMKGVSAIIALTESGRSPTFMSRGRTDAPIFALSRHQSTLSQLALLRGVIPVLFKEEYGGEKTTYSAVRLLLAQGYIKPGSYVVMTQGDLVGTIGSANTCRIVRA